MLSRREEGLGHCLICKKLLNGRYLLWILAGNQKKKDITVFIQDDSISYDALAAIKRSLLETRESRKKIFGNLQEGLLNYGTLYQHQQLN